MKSKNDRGRPALPASQARSIRIMTSCNISENKAFLEVAKFKGLLLAQWMRLALVAAAREELNRLGKSFD